MQDSLTIAVLAGTTRVQRESIKAAQYVADYGRKIKGIEIIFVDGNDPEGKDPRYTEITAKADAFFIVTPEYNHSFPGSLKRMLDSELKNYIHKPVAIAGASSGGWGGVRAVESLVPVVREMGLAATFSNVYFPRVQDLFDAQGHLKPEHVEQYRELLWLASALKWGRQNLEQRELLAKVPENSPIT
jgi:NAD(P)H-dependent FMN reductase